jgi:hypothetical protein
MSFKQQTLSVIQFAVQVGRYLFELAITLVVVHAHQTKYP